MLLDIVCYQKKKLKPSFHQLVSSGEKILAVAKLKPSSWWSQSKSMTVIIDTIFERCSEVLKLIVGYLVVVFSLDIIHLSSNSSSYHVFIGYVYYFILC